MDDLMKFKNVVEFKDSNYMMPLTAIDYHKQGLKRIIAACSEESYGDRDKFLKCMRNLFGKELEDMVNIRYIKNFEDAKSVYKFLESVYGSA